MDAVREEQPATGGLLAGTLFCVPLLAFPVFFLLGRGIEFDPFWARVLPPAGLMVTVALPGLVSFMVARFKGSVTWGAALAIGVGSCIVSAGYLLVAVFTALASCGAGCT